MTTPTDAIRPRFSVRAQDREHFAPRCRSPSSSRSARSRSRLPARDVQVDATPTAASSIPTCLPTATSRSRRSTRRRRPRTPTRPRSSRPRKPSSSRRRSCARTRKQRSPRPRPRRNKKREQCAKVRSQLAALQPGQNQQVLIFRANEKGEPVYMDDAARRREREQLQGWIRENCSG